MEHIVKLFDPSLTMDIRHLDAGEKQAALAWLRNDTSF
jgi:hypothetical protein